MQNIRFKWLIVFALSCQQIFGALKVAAIYPSAKKGVKSVGNEALCVTHGLVNHAKKQGLEISLTEFSNQRDAMSSHQTANKIVADGFDAVVGTLSSSEAIPAASVFSHSATPFFVPTASHIDVTHNKPSVVGLVLNDVSQGKVIARFLNKEMKLKKVAIVQDLSKPNCILFAETVQKELAKLSVKTKVHEVFSGFNRFSPLTDELVEFAPQAIVLSLSSLSAAAIYHELVKRNVSTTLIGGDSIGGRQDFFKKAGNTSPKIRFLFVKHWSGKYPKSNALSLYQQILKNECAGQDDTMITASAFDAMYSLLEAHQKNPAARKAKLAQLAKATPIDALSGKLSFSPSGQAIRDLHLYQIKENRASYWKSIR